MKFYESKCIMARGRMLNQKIAEDEQFNAMSIEAQFMFMRVIPFLDRDGLITGHPILLQSKVVPLLPDFSAKMPALIAEWVDAGLVISYTAGKSAALFFKGFSKNNNIHYTREGPSSFPPPPGYYRNGNGLELITDDQSPDEEQDNSNSGGDIPPVPPNSPAAQDEYKTTPDEVRIQSGLTPDEVLLEVKVEVKDQLQQPGARASEAKAGGGGEGLRQTNPEFAEVCTAIECNGFGMMTQILSDEVADLLKDYPSPWILDAMKIAVKANKRKLSYVDGILKRWRADGRDPPPVAQAQAPPAKVDYAIAGML